MGIFSKIEASRIEARRNEEHYFEVALEEIGSGKRRPGLWAKALAEKDGNIEEAHARYIQLLAVKLRDDDTIAHDKTTKLPTPTAVQQTKAQQKAKEKSQKNWVTQQQKSSSSSTTSGLIIGCLSISAIFAVVFIVLFAIVAIFDI